MDQISDAAWDAQVTSRQRAQPHPFADEIGEDPTLLVFLRHLG